MGNIISYIETFYRNYIKSALTLAGWASENEGDWEVEYNFEEENNLDEKSETCEKNRRYGNHKDYIPVEQFNIDCLQEDYCNQDVVDYIHTVANLTVLVKVMCVSDRRQKRKQTGSSGTGLVKSVCVHDGSRKNTCKCKDFQNSRTPQKNFAKISIQTAKHIVFDNFEAKHTICHLFFDKGSTPDTCEGVFTLTGFCEWSDKGKDVCYIHHYRHDLDIANRLLGLCQQKDKIEDKIRYPLIYTHIPVPAYGQPLLFIVSHPHGCSKQISLGFLTWVKTIGNVVDSFLYGAATCHGSSGAPVYSLEGSMLPNLAGRISTISACHRGASKEKPGMNYCHPSQDNLCPERACVMMLQLERGNLCPEPMCVTVLELYKGSAKRDSSRKRVEGPVYYHTLDQGKQTFFIVEKFKKDKSQSHNQIKELLEHMKMSKDTKIVALLENPEE